MLTKLACIVSLCLIPNNLPRTRGKWGGEEIFFAPMKLGRIKEVNEGVRKPFSHIYSIAYLSLANIASVSPHPRQDGE